MCFLALFNPSFIKQLSLKFKKHLCCRSKNNNSNDEENNKNINELFELEEHIDAELLKILNDVHKFKNNLYNFKKHKRVYWSNYDN